MSQTSIELQSQSPRLKLTKSTDVLPTISRPLTFREVASSHSVDGPGAVAQVEAKRKTILIITAVTLVTGTASMLNGIVTVSLPTLAIDLDLGTDLLFWYNCFHHLHG